MAEFNLNPAPVKGDSAFGYIPGQLGVPESIYSQVSGLSQQFPAATERAMRNINSDLSGQLSPGTMAQLQNASAAWGINAGLPFAGEGIPMSHYLKSIGTSSEGLRRQGMNDYLALLSGVGQTMTNPALASDIASQNAVWAAAPDPKLAQEYAQSIYSQNLDKQQANQLALIEKQAALQNQYAQQQMQAYNAMNPASGRGQTGPSRSWSMTMLPNTMAEQARQRSMDIYNYNRSMQTPRYSFY